MPELALYRMTSSFGVCTNFRGKPCVENCMIPIGRHDASGLSLLLRAIRFGQEILGQRRQEQTALERGGDVAKGGERRRAGLRLWRRCTAALSGAPRHVPEKSGLPSGVRGAGAFMSGLPSAVLGVGYTGHAGHCAASVDEQYTAHITAINTVFDAAIMR